MAIEWNILTAEQFESLCYDVLSRSGYQNLEWFGSRGGGDRCRDIKCEKTEEILPGKETRITCIAQCKRHISQPPSESDLADTISWADAHQPKRLFIMVSNMLSSNTIDWLNLIRPQKRYDIVVYDEKNFEGFFETNADLYIKYFEREFSSPRNSVIGSLLDMEYKTTDRIVAETGIAQDQVEPILHDQHSVKVSAEEGKPQLYYVEPTMTSFLDLAHRLLVDEKTRLKFLQSRFCREVVKQELMDYIQSRFHVTLNSDLRTSLAQLFSISPSALDTVISAPTLIYDTGYADVQRVGLKGEQLEKWNETVIATLMSDLLPGIMQDLRKSSGKALEENKIEGYNINVGIKMANSKASLLDIECETTILSLPARGSVEAGQLVSVTDPDLYIKVGTILANMKLFQKAISSYDMAIAEIKDTKKLAEAWNNKGVCLWRYGRKPEAIGCFEKAQELDPSLAQARDNEEKCRADLNSSNGQKHDPDNGV